MLKEKIGLIGVGNMGSSILDGLFAKKLVSPEQIWVYDKLTEKAADYAKTRKVQLATSNLEAVQNCKVVLLAVKPQDLTATAQEFLSALTTNHILISILAGTPVAKLKAAVGAKPRVVRVMPNLGAKVGESMTALCSENVEALNAAESIFNACGKTVRLKEEHFDLFTAVCGSGPAYFFLVMELLMKECAEQGIDPSEARKMAVQTAYGAAKLAQDAKELPAELRQAVTSRGGTTEAALKVLFEYAFPQGFHEALQAAAKRGKELSQG